MDIRKAIKQELNVPTKGGNFDKLLYSAQLPQESISWFAGVIGSLYYKPNDQVLVLEGKNTEQNKEFLRWLTPDYISGQNFWYTSCQDMSCAWEVLIWKFDFYKSTLGFPNSDGFRIIEPEGYGQYPCTDKRLASFCSTTNKWQFKPRKNFIVCKVDYIDKDLYDGIDKLELWREIFQMFKPLR